MKHIRTHYALEVKISLVSFGDGLEEWIGIDYKEEAEKAQSAEKARIEQEFDESNGYTHEEWTKEIETNVLLEEEEVWVEYENDYFEDR